MFNYYKFNNKLLFSKLYYPDLNQIPESEALKIKGESFFLYELDPLNSRMSFCLSHPSLINIVEEDLSLLELKSFDTSLIPKWLLEKIDKGSIKAINTKYPYWKNLLENTLPSKWKINLIGTGDVGGILATGLRLLGNDCISEIGLYGKDSNSVQRWEYEINQIISPSNNSAFPKVTIIDEDEIFNCDFFIFCASAGVPPVGQEKQDVRMVQFEKNKNIISIYAKLARKNNFKGIFAVVSDPVDLLCKAALIESNRDEDGNMDFNGLTPEQIRGYGLGVMNARAIYYSQKNNNTLNYITEGRAYGPHGDGLVIANSIENYNQALSIDLTQKVKKANLDVRSTGFKPYIAPALSSGALSILAAIKGDWHYSATFIGGVYMGAKNKLNATGTELEQLELPKDLKDRLNETYINLGTII